jgi:hypothetical protein
MQMFKKARSIKSVLATGLLTMSLSSAWALPKEIEIDRLVLGIETAVEKSNWDKAHTRLTTLKALNDELPPVYFYYRGKVSTEQEDWKAAREALEQYLSIEGKEAEYYRASLALLNHIEEQESLKVDEEVKSTVATHLVLEDSEHKQYINQLKKLYLVDDGRDALELHINTLLSHHRYIPGRYRSDRHWAGSLYQIQVRKNMISVMEKRSNSQGGYSINQDQLGVYGVNPYLTISCDSVGDQCWVEHPESGKQWLELESNRGAADDIAKAFTHLIRYMQGG